jgi:thioredoxin-dependent peroxiredoxin
VALKPGDVAPDCEVTTHEGKTIRLSELWARNPVVIFFYPKAFTPGCTAEACHFRDLRAEFEGVGATVVGISTDSVDTQARFSERYGLGFTLVSDPRGEVARRFGVKRKLLPFDKRTTFVIAKGGKILERIDDEFSMEVHADKALEILRSAGAGRRSESGASQGNE